MSNWTASNYRQRRADRLRQTKPEWVTNSETGERFYLRQVRAVLSSVLAGALPSSLTAEAVKAWQEQGVDGPDKIAETVAAKMSPEQLQDGAREIQRLSQIIQQSCVIPFLSNEPASKIQFTDEWKQDAIAGLKELDPSFDPVKFDPTDVVLDPRELDGADSSFLFKWAAGMVADVIMKGGDAANISDISRFRKKPGRVSRARNDRASVRKAS
ncbi:MAG TPA: hypothetical protein VIX17_11375 [Pyrinomonadaceae bacterium]|jgi:hypothetical protein